MKFITGKQAEQQSEHLYSFAHFTRVSSISPNSISSHLDICCAVQHNYAGFWIVDSGASDHMISNLNLLHNIKTLPKPIGITLPNGSLKTVIYFGQIHLTPTITIDHVLYVPDFKFNLLSVNKLLTAHNLLTLFLPDQCLIQDLSTGMVIAVAQSVNELYKISHAVTNTPKNKDHTTLVMADTSTSFVSAPLNS